MADPILQVRNLTKEFAGFTAVDAVSFDVERGAIHALIGPNGAGKTTCFNIITKFLSPTSGTLVFEGRNVTQTRPADVARMGLVRSFQISAIFPELSLLENVRLALMRATGWPLRFWRSDDSISYLDENARELLNHVGLRDRAASLAGELSYGRKRALEIVTTLALKPKLLLLDEPTSGMGREDIAPITELIRNISETCTILIVEHNLKVVEALSTNVTVLARGRVLAEGAYHSIARDREVISVYLGRRAEVLRGKQ